MTKIRSCRKFIYEISDAIPSRHKFNWIFPKSILNAYQTVHTVLLKSLAFGPFIFDSSVCGKNLHTRPLTTWIHQSISSHPFVPFNSIRNLLQFYRSAICCLSVSTALIIFTYVAKSQITTDEELRMRTRMRLRRWYVETEQWFGIVFGPVHCGQVIWILYEQ